MRVAGLLFAAFACLLVLPGKHFVAGVSITCPAVRPNFISSTRSCISCPGNSTFIASTESCACVSPFVSTYEYTGEGATLRCIDCSRSHTMPGVGGPSGAAECLPCSEDSPSFTLAPDTVMCPAANASDDTTTAPPLANNVTLVPLPTTMAPEPTATTNVSIDYSNATVTYAHSSWDASSSSCTCPDGYVLTARASTRYLGAWACLRCEGCATRCPSPLEYNVAVGGCRCPEGFTTLTTASGTRCLPEATLSSILSTATSLPTAVRGRNLDNSGRTTDAFPSHYIATNYEAAAAGCIIGNTTACNLLANLCVFSGYDLGNVGCAVYRQMQLREACFGVGCQGRNEVPTSVPWLFYLRSSSDILGSTAIKLRAALQPWDADHVTRMRLVLASYAADGRFLGHEVVTSQLSACDIPAAAARSFWLFGARREAQCNLNLRWYLQAPEAAVFEMFLEDVDGTLHDVPAVLLQGGANDGDYIPTSTADSGLVRSAGGVDGPVEGGFKRRFYLYDNVASRASSGARPAFITYARRIQVMFTLRPGHESKIFPPVLLIHYATVETEGLAANSDVASGELLYLRTNSTGGEFTDSGIDRVLYVQTTSEAVFAARTSVIVITLVLLITALIRTYGWMRRQQDMVLGLSAAVRYLIYYFNHVSNVFVLFDVIFCGVFYVFFKHQASVEYLLPEDYRYITGTLYAATAMKACVVAYRIFEQTNADIFVIDWERSKGALKTTDKEVSVSMWRSTFIANEFNEMQLLRGFHVLIHMFIVAAFLEGANFIRLAQSVPSGDEQVSDYTATHDVLRIAVSSFWWLVVGLVFHILEYQVYYRFFQPHPLQAFVDLCSVSNISIMVLLEPQWGFYIHGESIQAYADVSMEEFQNNLDIEAQGNLPQRGIAGNCQTFEVFLGAYMRQFLNVSYAELHGAQNQLAAMGGPGQQSGRGGAGGAGHDGDEVALSRPGPGPSMPGPGYGGAPVQQQVNCFEFLRKKMPMQLNAATVNIKQRINSAFQASVREAQRSVLAKFGVHEHFDFPPNILYMNGPFAGEKAGGDLFFTDDVKAYGKALMYGLDFDVFLLYMMLFLSIDTGLQNVFGSMAITFVLELAVSHYRGAEGEANIARKTLFDDRFFL